MNEQQTQLLDRHSVLILPEEIDHDVYALLLEATLYMAGKPIRLYCRGVGGGARDALAIVDLIQAHGDVTGMLAGEACSSHGIVWAACMHRYVYPYGQLAVHMVARDGILTRVDAHSLKQTALDLKRTNQTNAAILANASNRPVAWWYKVIVKAGSAETVNFDAAQLIEMDMARPIAEYKATLELEQKEALRQHIMCPNEWQRAGGSNRDTDYIDAVSRIPIPK